MTSRVTNLFFAFLIVMALALTGSAQQAGLDLSNGAAAACYNTNTTWSLTKTDMGSSTLSAASGTIQWTVTVTKLGVSDKMICVDGLVTITNTGSAPAPVGNIIVNLQQFVGKVGTVNVNSWVSAAADAADATNGDGSVKDNLPPSATKEDQTLNAAYGPGNYKVNGSGLSAYGTFSETAGSGPLSFMDASNNTIWALTDPSNATIPVGSSVTLKYSAQFNNTVLNLPATAQLRAEVLVSFSNSGDRGGSGASGTNIDVNGDGASEANVRTVVDRQGITLPALQNCNSTVTLTDTSANTSSTGSITLSNFGVTQPIPTSITESGTYTVSLDYAATTNGTISNTATLQGSSSTVTPLTSSGLPVLDSSGNPITFPCCVATALHASDTFVISLNSDPRPSPSGFCSYTQGGWGAAPHGGNVGAFLAAKFGDVYTSGVTVGGNYTMKFSSAPAIEGYLPAGGPSASLTASLLNPTSSSSGVFGGQVLALEINSDFSSARLVKIGFGALVYHDPTSPLDGKTVAQILSLANEVLGGNVSGLPSGFTINDLNTLVTNLNESFDNCAFSGWGAEHLSYAN